jgi:phage gp29-like protein
MIKLLSLLVATMLLPAIYISEGIQTASATGGGEALIKHIQPMIDRAIQALNNGQTDVAMEELDTIQKELLDKFDLKAYEEENEGE